MYGGNDSEVENVQLQGNFQEDNLNDLDFGKCYDELVFLAKGENSASQSDSSQMQSECKGSSLTTFAAVGNKVERYVSIGMQPYEENPLDWWKVNM